jgi:acetyl-CoA C-acetyltransferase
MSRVQIGLSQGLSDWMRKFLQAKTSASAPGLLRRLKPLSLFIPKVVNRTTGMSMGEHTEITAKDWQIPREDQDRVAFASHQTAVAAWDRASSTTSSSRSATPKRTTSPQGHDAGEGWPS